MRTIFFRIFLYSVIAFTVGTGLCEAGAADKTPVPEPKADVKLFPGKKEAIRSFKENEAMMQKYANKFDKKPEKRPFYIPEIIPGDVYERKLEYNYAHGSYGFYYDSDWYAYIPLKDDEILSKIMALEGYQYKQEESLKSRMTEFLIMTVFVIFMIIILFLAGIGRRGAVEVLDKTIRKDLFEGNGNG